MKNLPMAVLVGHGRMAAALRGTLASAYARVWPMVGRKVSRGIVRRPATGRLVWVLAVPDVHVEATVLGLAEVLRRGDVVLHVAGMLGPDVLAGARAHGAAVGAMHPLAAVATTALGTSLAGTTFLMEGDAKATMEARRIARAVAGRLIIAKVNDRARYHGAAALVATGAVALAQGAAWMLTTSTDRPPTEAEIRDAIASLLQSVARNVQRVGVRKALASPLLRNETTTVARHLDAMKDDATVQALYAAAVARVVVPLAEDATVSPETLARVRKILVP